MRNSNGRKERGGVGFIPSSFRTISSYLRIVSSGASTVARSAASVASSIVERDDDCCNDQVLWAGFDKLDDEDIIRKVLLLGYRSCFQVWDVEEADNVRSLVSRQDGPVSFMQILPKPVEPQRSGDKFAESRPLLVVCADGSSSIGSNIQDGLAINYNGSIRNSHDPVNGSVLPSIVRFYSLKAQSFVHVLKFRSVVYSVRCSSRVVAISQATQIDCFDSTTLERQYTILTNPVVTSSPGSGGIGYGPLAVGPRWLAYSGSPIVVSNSRHVSPQHLTPSSSFSGFSSNGSLVAHYAKESSKHLAVGIVTLGDMGYKKLSRYCSELVPDSNGAPPLVHSWKGNGTVNGHLLDAENVGMVIVRDIVSKLVIAQFRAHKSPISALCFDPTGTLLVTASVRGHNINVYKIMPGLSGRSSASESGASYVHLYQLQRGFTNAVIQDISFSNDSNWIMISSLRGTSHLFAINPLGGFNIQSANATFNSKSTGLGVMNKSTVRCPSNSSLQMSNQHGHSVHGPPVTLSVVSRIRNGSNAWSGAAAAAAGRLSSLSGAIASTFHDCKGNELCVDGSSFKEKYHLLVFSPSGHMIQYALRMSNGMDSAENVSGVNIANNSAIECDGRLVVDAIQKWSMCEKQNRREQDDNIDIYGEKGNLDRNKIYPEGIKNRNSIFPEENNHLYISEAELQMHARTPLWARSEICFHSMMIEGIKMDEENALGGEIEIERIPTHMIEARSKDLVPVFEYFQTPKFQHTRVPASDGSNNGPLVHQRSGMSINSKLLSSGSSGTLDSMTDNGTALTEHQNDDEIEWCGPQMAVDSKDTVNNDDSAKTMTRSEIVNNRVRSKLEAQPKFVNNTKGTKMEKHFEDEVDEFG